MNTVLEYFQFITIAHLKDANVFKKNSVGRAIEVSIGYESSMVVTNVGSKIILDYQYNGEELENTIHLTNVKYHWNGGFADHLMFDCQVTGKPCRKLYFDPVQKCFVQRDGIDKRRYRQQTITESQLPAFIMGNKLRKLENKIKIVSQPYFRTHYAGQETKRYAGAREAQAKLRSMLRLCK